MFLDWHDNNIFDSEQDNNDDEDKGQMRDGKGKHHGGTHKQATRRPGRATGDPSSLRVSPWKGTPQHEATTQKRIRPHLCPAILATLAIPRFLKIAR